jgi:nucleoside-diphosphate-sugar epimerase
MGSLSNKRAVILGAGGIIGPYLLERLIRAGYTVDCLSRRQAPSPRSGARWITIDVTTPGAWRCRPETIVFSILPLWLLPPVLSHLSAARQIIAFSSTGILTKIDNADGHERALAQRLRKSEHDLANYCEESDLPWTVLRPTLIYGGGADKNVSSIARFIRWFGFFPVASPARGLRQPVHAEDLANAATACIGNRATWSEAFDLPGGETIDYREMVRRIFQAMGKRPVIVPLPELPLRLAASASRALRIFEYDPAVFSRMNWDLVFDDAPARCALGYSPRRFEPELPANCLIK